MHVHGFQDDPSFWEIFLEEALCPQQLARPRQRCFTIHVQGRVVRSEVLSILQLCLQLLFPCTSPDGQKFLNTSATVIGMKCMTNEECSNAWRGSWCIYKLKNAAKHLIVSQPCKLRTSQQACCEVWSLHGCDTIKCFAAFFITLQQVLPDRWSLLEHIDGTFKLIRSIYML